MARWERNLDAFMASVNKKIQDGLKATEAPIDRKVGTVYRLHLKKAPPTIDVLVGDAEGINAYPPHANIYPNVKFGKGYYPELGEQVVMIKKGTDFWVVNAVESKVPSKIVNANELQGYPIKGSKPKKGATLVFNGSTWVPTIVPDAAAVAFPYKSSWARQGLIFLPAAGLNDLPPDLIYVPDGIDITLVQVFAIIGSGTSVTIELQVNGSTVAGLGAMVIEPFASVAAMTYTPSAPHAMANGDRIQPIPTAISAAPDDLSLVACYTVEAS